MDIDPAGLFTLAGPQATRLDPAPDRALLLTGERLVPGGVELRALDDE